MLKHILSHISTGQMPVTQSQCIYQLSQCNVRASTFVLSSTTLVKQVWHGLSQTYGRPLLCQTGVACISPPNLSPIGLKKHVSHLFDSKVVEHSFLQFCVFFNVVNFIIKRFARKPMSHWGR